MFTTHYFETRTLARNNVAVLNGKFKDFGTDAPKGQRWAVLVEAQEAQPVPEVKEEIKIEQATTDNSSVSTSIKDLHVAAIANAMPNVSFTPGMKRRDDLKTPNGKPVRLMVRRSMVAVRLAQHMANHA